MQIIEHCGGWRKAITLPSGAIDAETDTTVWPQQERVEMLETIRAQLVNKVGQLTEQIIGLSLREPNMDTARAPTTTRRVRRRDRASSPIRSATSDAADIQEQSPRELPQEASLHRSEAVVQTDPSWAMRSTSTVDGASQTMAELQPIATDSSDLGHNAEESQTPSFTLASHQPDQDAMTQTAAIQMADVGVGTDTALTQVPATPPPSSPPPRRISTTREVGCQSEDIEAAASQTKDAQQATSDLCATREIEEATTQTDNDTDNEVSDAGKRKSRCVNAHPSAVFFRTSCAR